MQQQLSDEKTLWEYALKMLILFGTIVTICSFVFFSVVIIYTLTLGSFDDFQEAQNLILPLVIGALAYFIIKPTKKQVKEKFGFGGSKSTTT